MDFSRPRKVKKIATGSLTELYSHTLQMYVVPPIHEISLSEFEELALERLKVLRCLELVNLRGAPKFSDEWKSSLSEEMTKQGLKNFYRMSTSSMCEQSEAHLQFRKRDHLSHFILRLAYCRSEDLRRWFIAREVELFRLRFLSLSTKEIQNFLLLNNLYYVPISSEEKESIKEGLLDSTYGLTASMLTERDFYKIAFTDVLELVRSRKVFLQNGYTYIPSTEFVAVLSSVFRANLAQALMLTFRRLPNLEEDQRLIPLLKGLHTSYTGDDFKSPQSGAVRIEDMDKYARTSFPLCMRYLHETFRSVHHLRHGSRLQYGLFIKGIGVSLEDALRFWREEFCKLIDLDKFEKQYSYTIRHSYGKEGKRTDYTPYSCLKIISFTVGPGDTHGCPFKHSDTKALASKLQHYGVQSNYIGEITDLVNRGHYQIACGKYFEATHGKPSESGIQHPNQYFQESQSMLGVQTAAKPESSSQTAGTPNQNMSTAAPGKQTEVIKEEMWAEDFDFSGVNVDMAE